MICFVLIAIRWEVVIPFFLNIDWVVDHQLFYSNFLFLYHNCSSYAYTDVAIHLVCTYIFNSWHHCIIGFIYKYNKDRLLVHTCFTIVSPESRVTCTNIAIQFVSTSSSILTGRVLTIVYIFNKSVVHELNGNYIYLNNMFISFLYYIIRS